MTNNATLLTGLAMASLFFVGAANAQQTIYVTTSADVTDIPQNATIDDLPGPDGVVSFREALRASDNTPGHQTVGFQIPEDDWYLHDIFPGQVLLQGSFNWSAAQPVTIDGTTQTDFTGDTYPDGNEVILPLQTYLNGDGSIVTGLHDSRVEFNGSNNDIHGNTGGMFIALYFGAGTVVHDNEAFTININYGMNNRIVRNTTQRVRITGQSFENPATGNHVGGPDDADRNFITGFGNWGEHGAPSGTTVELYYTRGTVIENNYIGTTPDGMAIGNDASTVGIGIFNRNDDLTIRDNLIAILAHGVFPVEGVPFGQPIYLENYGEEDGPCRNIDIVGNTLGLNALGAPALGGVHGIWVSRYAIEYCENVRIESNVIAGHLETGVLMEYGPGDDRAGGIRLSANSIYNNGEIGIDLMPNTWDFGPTPNDPLDADEGANGLQNYPELASATSTGQSLHLTGSLHTEPSSEYTIEFFASETGDPSGFGQGEVYLGSTSVNTNAAGNAMFDIVLPVNVPAGRVVSSTATSEPVGETSEFSAWIAVEGSGEVAELVDYTVEFGFHIAGGLPELISSDDQRLHLRSNFGFSVLEPNLMKARIGAVTGVSSPGTIDLTVESRLNNPGGTATLSLVNWSTNSLEPVATYAIGTAEESQSFTGLDAADRVRGMDNRIELQIKHVVVATFSALGFDSFIDQVELSVN